MPIGPGPSRVTVGVAVKPVVNPPLKATVSVEETVFIAAVDAVALTAELKTRLPCRFTVEPSCRVSVLLSVRGEEVLEAAEASMTGMLAALPVGPLMMIFPLPRLVPGMSSCFVHYRNFLTSDHSFTLREGGKTSEFPSYIIRNPLIIALCSRDWHCH